MKRMMRSRNKQEEFLALVLVLMGVFFRVLPHPDNFTPTTAIALFAGVTLSPALAFTVPLAVMVASDFFIGFHSTYPLVWACFLFVTWLGQSVREKEGVMPLAFATLGGSVLFFILTNLGVFFIDNLYPTTAQGLVECFTMALPFFRSSLLGDFLYTAALFSIFELARRGIRAFQKA